MAFHQLKYNNYPWDHLPNWGNYLVLEVEEDNQQRVDIQQKADIRVLQLAVDSQQEQECSHLEPVDILPQPVGIRHQVLEDTRLAAAHIQREAADNRLVPVDIRLGPVDIRPDPVDIQPEVVDLDSWDCKAERQAREEALDQDKTFSKSFKAQMAEFSKGTLRMKSVVRGGLGDMTMVLLAQMEKFFNRRMSPPWQLQKEILL